jgi:fumarylacetoacetate (FAA) hydrolase family protein
LNEPRCYKKIMNVPRLTPGSILPQDGGLLVGRVWTPGPRGGEPLVVAIADRSVFDITDRFGTMAEVLNDANPSVNSRPRLGVDRPLGSLDEFLAGVPGAGVSPNHPHLLAPCDLQPIKASGVTFLVSLKERVIEEAARGDPERAGALRREMSAELDRRLSKIKPGSTQAAAAKEWLIANHLWSQYLEVAIGPDAEIFSKAPPMSAVGEGANIGVLRRSEWNNPEPEVVLAISRTGNAVGAALGNDVNLRDLEGRSALLLGRAKDNNGSCAIGPFIRLFDESFGMNDVRAAEISLDIEGPDGFTLHAASRMEEISRDPEDLVRQTIGPDHHYPDGVMLFLGSMFAPTQDRDRPGRGFTHKVGDIVSISSPKLGTLVNRVDYCDAIEPWTFGITELLKCVRRTSQD